jgi:hypothetical protein
MNWCEFISEVYAARQNVPGMASKAVFQPPASNEDVTAIELQLNVNLPTDLNSLLRETNGVLEMDRTDDNDWFVNMWLLWTTSEIIEQNRHLRRATMHPYDDNRRYCPTPMNCCFLQTPESMESSSLIPSMPKGLRRRA